MYTSSWNSLQAHAVPQWLKDAKFGIYTHWGVYAVPACGPNATWYPYNMYREGSLQNLHHMLHYGNPASFGYKDFIPLFKGEHFDPDEWAEIFRDAGARFAGPVAEHHDGFSMWDSRINAWNASRMGPGRDIVGELEKSIRRQGMRFLTALHHAENWWFYPHWKQSCDVADPAFAGLYGDMHDQAGESALVPADPNPRVPNHNETWPLQQKPSRQFLERWIGKIIELVDRYEPDMLWFDFGLKWIQENYKTDMAAYYYNRGKELGKDFIITCKWFNMAPGSGVEDIEQGKRHDLAYNFWITDTNADAGEAWGHIQPNAFKSPRSLVHYLIDNVSKNGALLLSIGPGPDGSICPQEKTILAEIGRWLRVNGEAIYGTTPWMHYGEGPTRMTRTGAFSESEEMRYTAKDFRFTVKDQNLYAICLGLPVQEVCLETAAGFLYPQEIKRIRMLGVDQDLGWRMTGEGLKIAVPERLPCDHAMTFCIERRHPFREDAPA